MQTEVLHVENEIVLQRLKFEKAAFHDEEEYKSFEINCAAQHEVRPNIG